jgi:large subunit ribosomal protein L25
MKKVSISGSLRENVGKKDAKKHRKEGNVPCVLYGGEKQVHFVGSEKDFGKIIFTPDAYLVNLVIDGKEYDAILQDIQYHPVTDKILHMDFLLVTEDKPVSIAVPVRFTGTSKGVLRGGKITKKYRKLMIKALPANLPDEVVVDVTELNIGQVIKVSDLKMENVEFLDVPTSVVATIKTTRGAAGEGEAEAS